MVQRQAVYLQWEKEVDLGRDMPSPRIFGGPVKLLIEEVIGSYFNVPMSDPAPPDTLPPLASEVFGLDVEIAAHTKDTNYLESPTGSANQLATVGKKINLLGHRRRGGKSRGKRVIVPTRESYERERNGETITLYKKKSFTFPYFFNVTMIRQALGQMIKRNYPQIITIVGTQYDFLRFPEQQQRFTPPGGEQVTSGAWLVDSEAEMLTKPASVEEEYWNRLYQSVASGVQI